MSVRRLACFLVAAALSAACAPAPRRITAMRIAPAAGSSVGAASAAAANTYWCPVTSQTVAAAEKPSHAGHHLEASAAHAVHAAPEAAHASHAPGHHAATGTTAHGPERVSLTGQREHSAHECVPTAEEAERARVLVERTREAIAKYAKAPAAMLAGYEPFGGGFKRIQHYTNDRYRKDPDVLYPEHVESLVYGHTDRHGLVLIGALYIMPKAGMRGPEIGGCLTQWHIHDWAGVEFPEMLHVWTVDMPGGPYAHEPDPEYIKNL